MSERDTAHAQWPKGYSPLKPDRGRREEEVKHSDWLS